jgi:hypothetical protein
MVTAEITIAMSDAMQERMVGNHVNHDAAARPVLAKAL